MFPPAGVRAGSRTKSMCEVLILFSFVLPGRAYGESKCSMHVVTDDVDAAWTAAARDAAQHFHNTAEGCVTIELRAAGDSMELVLITADDRRAVRQLGEPFEVAPTVRAMLVS